MCLIRKEILLSPQSIFAKISDQLKKKKKKLATFVTPLQELSKQGKMSSGFKYCVFSCVKLLV